MIQLDFGDHRPLYEQIKDKIKQLIINGVLSENDKIPSVRELAAELAINPNTIQQAYKDLEGEGYIYSLKAKGNFVSPHGKTAKEVDTSYLLESLCQTIRELRFLGINQDTIFDIAEKIYKEDKLW